MIPTAYKRVSRTHANTMRFRQHAHFCWEILYYTKNTGYLRLGADMEDAIPFREGTVICIPPFVEHGSACEGYFENICVQDLHFPQELQDVCGAHIGCRGCIVFQETSIDLLYLFQMIFRTSMKGSQISDTLINHLMACVYDILVEQCHMSVSTDFQVERMKNAILEHFTEPSYRITDSMKELLYSPAYIRNAFRKQCGMTPVQYLRMIRLKHAASLLEAASPSIPVSEIAYNSGFSDPLYFSKCFHQRYSVSPQTYREKHSCSISNKTEG